MYWLKSIQRMSWCFMFTFSGCPGPLCSHSTDVLVLMFTFNRCPGPLCLHSTDVLSFMFTFNKCPGPLCLHSTDVLSFMFTFNKYPSPLCSRSTDVLVLYFHIQQMSWSFMFNDLRWVLIVHFVDICGLVCWYVWTCLPSIILLIFLDLFAINV
jgi:hypothetical protein